MNDTGRLRSEVAHIYSLETMPAMVPTEESLKIGRLLVESGYKITGSFVVRSDNAMSVKAMLKEFDNTTSLQRSTVEDLESDGRISWAILYG